MNSEPLYNSDEHIGTSHLEIIKVHFEARLRSFIQSMVKDSNVADDILQEIYLKVHNKIDTLQDQTKIVPWLLQIARNLVYDNFRALKKGENMNLQELNEEVEISDNDTKIMDEAVGDMIRMMDNLPPDFCDALCRTELEGMSQKEYAGKTGLSYSGAKSRIQRARKLLKDMLMQCCHYEFDKYGTVLEIAPNCCCCCHPHKKSNN